MHSTPHQQPGSSFGARPSAIINRLGLDTLTRRLEPPPWGDDGASVLLAEPRVRSQPPSTRFRRQAARQPRPRPPHAERVTPIWDGCSSWTKRSRWDPGQHSTRARGSSPKRSRGLAEAMHQSLRGGRRDRTIAARRKGSSRGRRNCCSSWANTRATLTARSLARWPESHREQARGAFAEPPGAS